jgi:diguanylate cyclase (GGDEF)-like protein
MFLLLMIPLAILTILTATRVSEVGVAVLASGWMLLSLTAALYLTRINLLIAFLAALIALRIAAAVLNSVDDVGILIAISILGCLVVSAVVFTLTEGQRRLVAQMRDQALHDPLTGALNRRGAAEEALAVHAVARRASTPTTVAMIDLDDFKGLNDRYGHRTGDLVLSTLSHQWREELRAGDVLARIGGDEFLIVMPNTDLAEAEWLLDRLHQCNPIGWSSGTALWEGGDSLDDVMARADRDLYQAKARVWEAQRNAPVRHAEADPRRQGG